MAEFSWYLLQALREQPRRRVLWANDLEILMDRINDIERALSQPLSSWYGTDPVTGTVYGAPGVSIFAHPRITSDGAPERWYLRDRIDQLRDIGGADPFEWRYMPSQEEYAARDRKTGLDTRHLLEMLQAIGRIVRGGSSDVKYFKYIKSKEGVTEEISDSWLGILGDYRDICTAEKRTRVEGGRYYSLSSEMTYSHVWYSDYYTYPWTDPPWEGWPTRGRIYETYFGNYTETMSRDLHDPMETTEANEMNASVSVVIYGKDAISGDSELDRIEKQAPDLLQFVDIGGGGYDDGEETKMVGRMGEGMDVHPNYYVYAHRHLPDISSFDRRYWTRTPWGEEHDVVTRSTPLRADSVMHIDIVGLTYRTRRQYHFNEEFTGWDRVQSDTLPTTLDMIENSGTVIAHDAPQTMAWLWCRPTRSASSRIEDGATPIGKTVGLVDEDLERFAEFVEADAWEDYYTPATVGEYVVGSGLIDGNSDWQPDVTYMPERILDAYDYASGGSILFSQAGSSTASITMGNDGGGDGKVWLCWRKCYVPIDWPETLEA